MTPIVAYHEIIDTYYQHYKYGLCLRSIDIINVIRDELIPIRLHGISTRTIIDDKPYTNTANNKGQCIYCICCNQKLGWSIQRGGHIIIKNKIE